MFLKTLRFLIIFLLIMGGFFISGKNSFAATADHLVISEVQVAGTTANDEFIEIYNPTGNAVDISSWSIQYKGGTATSFSRKNFPSGAQVPAHSWYLIARTGYDDPVAPDMVHGSFSLSGSTLGAGGNVFLVNNQITLTSVNDVSVVDKVGYGFADSSESMPAMLPPDNQSIERKPSGDLGNGEDTDNNNDDFNLPTTPNPQNTSSPPKPDLPPPSCTPNWSCDDWQPTPATVCSEETFTQTRACNDLNSCGTTEGKPTETQQSIGTKNCTTPPTPTEINPGDVVINEFVSDPLDGPEWIEIFNNKDFNVDLTDWKLEDGAGTLTTLSGEIVPGEFLIVELSSSKLNNAGDIIILKKSDGTIIDQVAYGDWDDGNIFDNSPKASDPNSIARKIDGNDTDNDLADFAITTTLTKNSANIITVPPSEETGGTSTPTGTKPPSPPSWPIGTFLINEFVADPTDGEVEWIEFYNPSNTAINLNKWTIEDGGETATTLSGSVNPLGFFVLEKPKGLLNNSGDEIVLKDPAGVIIDQVTYGNWDDGDTSDNAPAASDPNSVARKTDGQNTSSDFNDFVIATPTRGTSNAEGVQQNPNGAYSRDIIINEILPNPKGDDGQGEFIELKNIGITDIDLTCWKIGDASSKRYTMKAADFSSVILKPKEFFVLYRKVTGIALNNSGTEVAKIFSPDGALVHQIEYSGAAAEDESYTHEMENYFWTSTPTPGKENLITLKNQAPSAAISALNEGEINQTISFDGSDSTDPDGDELIFSWNFGDGSEAAGASASHTYASAGKYKIILTIKDSLGATDTAEQYILITNLDGTDEIISPAEQLIFINELLPNPEGSDDTEWIEIKNIDIEPVDLSGWKLDDDEGGSRPYKIPEGTIINPGQFLIFKKSETKLAFNNTYDAVRLLDPDGEIFFETSYDEVPEGASWARDEVGDFKWTTKLTPGAENIFQFQEKVLTKKSSSSSGKKSTTFTPTTLEEIRNLDLNDGVRVSGQVIAEPGVLASQIFYIADPEACPGIQIYMYSKNFPKLKLGDLIQVSGVLSESGGEKRIKVSAKENIKILESRETPAPAPIKLSEVEEGLEGCLVSASGELTEKSGSNLYFADDDGELKIYFKSTLSFPKPKMDIGDGIETVGIVSQTKTGFRLLPRYETDLKIKTPALEPTAFEMPTESGGGKINLYLGAATGLLGLTLVGLGIKSGTFGNWWKKIKGI